MLAAGVSLGLAGLILCAQQAELAPEQPLREGLTAGPLAQEFSMTLAPGIRLEAAGTLLSMERSGQRTQWTWTPLMSYTRDPDTDYAEFDLAYPLLTYDQFGPEFRVQLFQVLSFAGGKAIKDDANSRRFTLFPIYYQQRSDDPTRNYTAVWPFYGKMLNRIFRDEIDFVMWPAYVRTRKKDVITDNYLVPIFHLRSGDRLKGWQFWPVIGREQRVPGLATNDLEEVVVLPGHSKFFLLWPFFFNHDTEVGTTNPVHQQVLLPFYSLTRSPLRDSTTILFPLFTVTDDRGRGYREYGLPWPLLGFARGPGKTMNRVWPLYSHAHNDILQSDFILWPLYKYNRARAEPLDRERTRILFFLYSDVIERNTATGQAFRRRDLWPLFTARRDLEGNERLQVFAPLEPLIPNNKSIERNYSPVWGGLYRAEKNAKTGARSHSFAWNLYRAESGPAGRKVSLLFGLIQYQKSSAGRQWRLFYMPVAESRPPKEQP